MKLREFFYVMGYKLLGYTPVPQIHDFEIREQKLGAQNIRYAQWLHPKAYPSRVNESEVEWHKQFLQDGDVAIDIGAHAGDSTLPIAFAVGPTGQVLAFEANKFVFPTLQKNADLNQNLTSITPYNFAVTEENRAYEFSYNDPGFMNGGNTEKTREFRQAADVFRQEVQGVNLADFLSNRHPELISRIRFIKVDAEGYDLFIIKSIASLVSKIRPVVQVELMSGTSDAYREEVYEIFVGKGYTCFVKEDLENSIETVDQILNQKTIDMVCFPCSRQQLRTRTTAA